MFAFFQSASISETVFAISLFLLAAGITLAFAENLPTRLGGVFVALAAWVGLTRDWDTWAQGMALVSVLLVIAIMNFIAVRWKNLKKQQEHRIERTQPASTHWGENYMRIAKETQNRD